MKLGGHSVSAVVPESARHGFVRSAPGCPSADEVSTLSFTPVSLIDLGFGACQYRDVNADSGGQFSFVVHGAEEVDGLMSGQFEEAQSGAKALAAAGVHSVVTRVPEYGSGAFLDCIDAHEDKGPADCGLTVPAPGGSYGVIAAHAPEMSVPTSEVRDRLFRFANLVLSNQ
jgi:hypothetical protein